MITDICEKGLGSLIVPAHDGHRRPHQAHTAARPVASYGGTGDVAGSPKDYDRAHALDVPQLFAFLRATQPAAFKKLAMADANDPKDLNRLKFLARLSAEVGKRGVIDVLRKGIDMDSYRVEKKAKMQIALDDTDAEIAPVPTEGGGGKLQPELDRLSNILKTFNENFGTLFTDSDRVINRIRDDIVPKVAADKAYRNARDNTPHTARMAHDQALGRVLQILLKDDTQVYQQFVENESFRRFVGDMVYRLTSP